MKPKLVRVALYCLVVLSACRHEYRSQEIAVLSDAPSEISGDRDALVVTTLPRASDANDEDVYVVKPGEQPRLLKRYRFGKFDVDQDHLYYAEGAEGGVSVVPLSGGDARQLAPRLLGKPAAVEIANGSLFVLSADIEPVFRRIDLRTGAIEERRLPNIASNEFTWSAVSRRRSAMYVSGHMSGLTLRVTPEGAVDTVGTPNQKLECFAATENALWWLVDSAAGPVHLLTSPLDGGASSPRDVAVVGTSVTLCTSNEHDLFYTVDNLRTIESRASDGSTHTIARTDGDITAMYADEHAIYWAEQARDRVHWSIRTTRLQ